MSQSEERIPLAMHIYQYTRYRVMEQMFEVSYGNKLHAIVAKFGYHWVSVRGELQDSER